MARIIGELKLGKSELRANADLMKRLNFCMKQAKILNVYFTKEMHMEARGMAVPLLNMREVKALRMLRAELGTILNLINRLMHAEGYDIRT